MRFSLFLSSLFISGGLLSLAESNGYNFNYESLGDGFANAIVVIGCLFILMDVIQLFKNK